MRDTSSDEQVPMKFNLPLHSLQSILVGGFKLFFHNIYCTSGWLTHIFDEMGYNYHTVFILLNWLY